MTHPVRRSISFAYKIIMTYLIVKRLLFVQYIDIATIIFVLACLFSYLEIAGCNRFRLAAIDAWVSLLARR